MSYKDRVINIISLMVGIVALLVPSIFFIISASESIRNQSLIIFGIIVITVIIIFIVSFIYFRYQKMSFDIENNKRKIYEIQNSLNFKELFNKMDIRLAVLEKLFEKKDKKGQIIDPRIIGIIVLLILLYLFLKSIKVLP